MMWFLSSDTSIPLCIKLLSTGFLAIKNFITVQIKKNTMLEFHYDFGLGYFVFELNSCGLGLHSCSLGIFVLLKTLQPKSFESLERD